MAAVRRSRPGHDRAEKGVSIIIVALLLIPLLIFVGLATDVGGWYARAANIQRAADAAALAGVAQLSNGVDDAVAEARRVATLNGYTHGEEGITVAVGRVAGTSRLFVEITDTDVERYFTAPFHDTVSITRRATAEHVQPVPLGSPRNYLGIQPTADPANEVPTSMEDNYYVSISGYCSYREHGDRITPAGDSQHDGTFQGCNPGTNGVRANPEFLGRYFFGITFPAAASNQVVQIFDAPYCGNNAVGDEGHGGGTTPKEYTFRLRSPNPDPEQAPIISGTEFTLDFSDCGTWGNQWHTLGTIDAAAGDTYYLEVVPEIPTDTEGADSQEGQNRMALRVNPGGGSFSGEACSTSVNEPGYSASCQANIYALTHLGIQANVPANPIFYLADIGPEHNGKLLEVELFDAAEGNTAIELIPPTDDPVNQAPVTVRWEVSCMDGSFRSDNGGACQTATGEAAPRPAAGGACPNPGDVGADYGPFTSNRIVVCGDNASYRPWGDRNSQSGRFSDRLIRLTFQLPDDIADEYNGRTWWRIRYIVASTGSNDRTTWSVTVAGDPVRLVPND